MKNITSEFNRLYGIFCKHREEILKLLKDSNFSGDALVDTKKLHKFSRNEGLIRGDVIRNIDAPPSADILYLLNVLEIDDLIKFNTDAFDKTFGLLYASDERLYTIYQDECSDNTNSWKACIKASRVVSCIMYYYNLYHQNMNQLLLIYQTNVMSNIYGKKDVTKAVIAIAKYLKRVERSDVLYHKPYDYPKTIQWHIMAELIVHIIEGESRGAKTVLGNDGIKFEVEIAEILRSAGLIVSQTKASGDFGGDLIAEINDVTYCIQCKATAKAVGIKAVQEVYGARKHYSTDYAVVVTNAGYTDAAIELAVKTGVVLCTGDNIKYLENMGTVNR